ncbi:unnamed protein product [Cuscuta campestris]|uniref:DNA repair metallo-beta-lactamase domain-containing protein n=1 Tax=Cuscuta campestris TaxID=132261 RepID=A0A484K809_9ASTE|nr:unnamed protein product [Cuscuta campestris]
MSAAPETLIIDSTAIYIAALNTINCQKLASSFRLCPLPSTIPQTKRIPKTRFIVDGFKHAGDFSVSYFLSHFNSDHCAGLYPNWTRGIIFCSYITARLLVQVLQVPAPFVVSLPLSKQILIDGCEVFLVDANYCPGAVQFLFKIPVPNINGKFERYVHAGAFRHHTSMELDPALSTFVGSDTLFLDATYYNPKYALPSKEVAIDYIIHIIESNGVEKEASPKSVLFLLSTYGIGKEKILIDIARRCKRKVCVESRKVLGLRDLGHGDEVFTEDESKTDIHVVSCDELGETWPLFRPNFVRVQDIMKEKKFSKLVGFVPTCWSYNVEGSKFSVRKKDSLEIHLVPYSEHSNYDELREYVKFLKPKCVIPTLGLDVEKLDRKCANARNTNFLGLVNEMDIKQDSHCVLQGVDENIVKGSAYDVRILELQIEASSSDVKESKDMENIDTSHAQKESNLLISGFMDEDAMEECIQELQVILPSWVIRAQMLYLLRITDRSLVDAVSHFYEHETEFQEQSELPLSEPWLIKNIGRNEIVSLSQSPGKKYKSISRKKSGASSNSSSKIKSNTISKSSKRAKLNSKMDSSGSKQCTITNFFRKVGVCDSRTESVRNQN